MVKDVGALFTSGPAPHCETRAWHRAGSQQVSADPKSTIPLPSPGWRYNPEDHKWGIGGHGLSRLQGSKTGQNLEGSGRQSARMHTRAPARTQRLTRSAKAVGHVCLTKAATIEQPQKCKPPSSLSECSPFPRPKSFRFWLLNITHWRPCEVSHLGNTNHPVTERHLVCARVGLL